MEFVELVAAMRRRQRWSDDCGRPVVPAEAKVYERRVDAAVKAILDDARPGLFDAAEGGGSWPD